MATQDGVEEGLCALAFFAMVSWAVAMVVVVFTAGGHDRQTSWFTGFRSFSSSASSRQRYRRGWQLACTPGDTAGGLMRPRTR